MSSYRYHPIIEGLKVNEDGTELLLNGRALHRTEMKIKGSNLIQPMVNIKGKSVTVNRLICECWHGAAAEFDDAAIVIDQNQPIHYRNLRWGKRGRKSRKENEKQENQ